MSYLLDTNVVSEMRKIRAGRADSNVAAWADSVPAASLYLSVISLQELEIGILSLERRDSVGGSHLRRWFEEQVVPTFHRRILPVDSNVALCSAQFHVPDPRPFRDSLIGATALLHGMTLVTRNTRDFSYLPCDILNPWEVRSEN